MASMLLCGTLKPVRRMLGGSNDATNQHQGAEYARERCGARGQTRASAMSAAFDTLQAARDMEAAGMDRKAAEAVAGAIRAGQGELATTADLGALGSRLETRIGALQWVIGVNLAISLATLAGVLAVAFGR